DLAEVVYDHRVGLRFPICRRLQCVLDKPALQKLGGLTEDFQVDGSRAEVVGNLPKCPEARANAHDALEPPCCPNHDQGHGGDVPPAMGLPRQFDAVFDAGGLAPRAPAINELDILDWAALNDK